MEYFIDILEPPTDLNVALDVLGNAVGSLYQRHWNEEQKKYYNDKAFSLNVQAFAQMWYNGDLKIFMAYSNDTKREPLGFLAGIVFRPMAYQARIFSIQDWYTGGDKALETKLFDYACRAIRVLNCDEILVSQAKDGDAPVIPASWKHEREFVLSRYTKE